MVHGVLRRDHDEGRMKPARFAVHAYGSFGHGFQQGRLSAWGRPIDFISQHELRKDRSASKFKLSGLLVKN